MEEWRAAAIDGSMLPAEPVLAERLGVSRGALREGLARLEREGLVRRIRGTGTVVNSAALDILYGFTSKVEIVEIIRDAGMEPTLEVLGFDLLTSGDVPARVPEALMLEGNAVLLSVKRWRADGRVVMASQMTMTVAATRHQRVRSDAGLFGLVREATGKTLEWVVTRPSAIVVDATIGEWLELEIGSPAMTFHLTGVARDGAIVFRAMEYVVPGSVPYGFIRTVA
jgi:GntR family transcriptional regulator